MKKMLTLVLALAMLAGCLAGGAAEAADPLKGVFEALTAEDSDYSRSEETYKIYYPDIRFDEELAEDGFTVTVSGMENEGGSWTFVRDGDWLAVTYPETQIFGSMISQMVLMAAGQYRGISPVLLNSYVSGMNMTGAECPLLTRASDGNGNLTLRIFIGEPYELTGLEDMVLTGDVLAAYGLEPLGAEEASRAVNYGKVMMIINGSASGLTILLREYGGVDNVGRQGLLNAIGYLKPAGGEAFTAAWTDLQDGRGDGWSVELNPDAATVSEIYPETFEGFKDAVILLGDRAGAGEG